MKKKICILFFICLAINVDLRSADVEQVKLKHVLDEVVSLRRQFEDFKEFVKRKVDEFEAKEAAREKESFSSKVNQAAKTTEKYVTPVVEKVKDLTTQTREWLADKIKPENSN